MNSTATSESSVENQIREFQPDIVVANKVDLQKFESTLVDFSVSASQGTGVDQLLDSLAKSIAAKTPSADQPFPVSVYQVTSLSTMNQYFESYYWQAARNLVDRLLPQTKSNFI